MGLWQNARSVERNVSNISDLEVEVAPKTGQTM
jgi:hypothetical protein